MPTTALITTKRKFHKILDSISNASSTSLIANNDKYNASSTTLPSSMDPPMKKARVTRPSPTYISSGTRSATRPGIKARPVSAIHQPASATMDVERKSPNFAPWDRGQFLRRLKSYRHVDKWMSKPEKINEVQWAKRGWSCVTKETVGCVGGCGKEVFIMLEKTRENKENAEDRTAEQAEVDEDEDDWREKAQAQLVEKYAEMITTAHDGGCLWRRRGCDDTIQRLPLAHQGTAIENLRQRHLSLVAMASELPSNPTMPESLDVSSIQDQILPLLYPPFEKPGAEASPPEPPSDAAIATVLNQSALSLALVGWEAEEGHITGLATCTACFRRLGLWLFKQSPDSSNPSSMDRLDVVGEHRDYCPWVNALSQNGAASGRTSLDGLAGWQILLRAINASKLHIKYDTEATPATPVTPLKESDNAASEGDSVMSLASVRSDRKDRDKEDKERLTKLKRLSRAFHMKLPKRRAGTSKKPGQPNG